MSEYWTEKDVMENTILDLQHENDGLKARIAELEACLLERNIELDVERKTTGRIGRDWSKGINEDDELRDNYRLP